MSVYYQNDPRWQHEILGFGDTQTIQWFGCLLTCLTNVGNHFGGHETPSTANAKFKSAEGFSGPWIKTFKISSVYPEVKYQKHIETNNQPAPLTLIDYALSIGSLAVVRVDYSPQPGIQSHWIVLHKKQGNDYLMWDPIQSDKPNTLVGRYGFAGTAAEIIQEGILFGQGDFPEMPPVEETAASQPVTQPPPPKSTSVSKPATPSEEEESIILKPIINSLPLRYTPRASNNNIKKLLSVSDQLRVLHADRTVKSRLGKKNQWIKVQDIEGNKGYVAAWKISRIDDPAFGVQSQTDATPTPPQKTVVKTTAEGVSLRTQPFVSAQTLITYLAHGTELKLLNESEASKIGQNGQWIQVETINGRKGYVAAWFVIKK